MAKRVTVKRRKAVGHITMMTSGITLNGVRMNDVNVSTDVYEGETFEQAILRATREQNPFQVPPVKPLKAIEPMKPLAPMTPMRPFRGFKK